MARGVVVRVNLATQGLTFAASTAMRLNRIKEACGNDSSRRCETL